MAFLDIVNDAANPIQKIYIIYWNQFTSWYNWVKYSRYERLDTKKYLYMFRKRRIVYMV